MPKLSLCRRVLSAVLMIGAVAANAAPDPRYVSGKAAWMARTYPPARTTLLTYRAAPSGRTADVDYMLGTSGCRIAEQRQWGARVLNFVLYRYALPRDSRALIENERTLCLAAATAMPVLTADVMKRAVLATAGAMARGKAGWIYDSKGPVNAYAARSLGTVERDAVTARLLPLTTPRAEVRARLEALAPGARLLVTDRYAIASTDRHSDADLATIARKLDVFIGFLENEYGVLRPATYLTIYLVPGPEQLRDAASRLHGLDVNRATIGYTLQDDQSAVAIVPGTGIGTLRHELFHLLVRSSFGDAPQWLDEGIASLYEVAEQRGNRFVGIRNWRGPVLARLWSQRPPLTSVIGSGWLVNDTPSQAVEATGRSLSAQEIAAQYGVARYFALFLQEHGKLGAVYRGVRDLQPGDSDDPRAAAQAVVVAELGPIDKVQADFDAWFVALEAVAPSAIVTKNCPAVQPQQQQNVQC